MANSKEIIQSFDEHLKTSGRQFFSDFYIGITNDVDNGIFRMHNVKRNQWWVYCSVDTLEDAKEVVDYYKSKGMRYSKYDERHDKPYIVFCYTVTQMTIEQVTAERMSNVYTNKVVSA